MKTTPSRIRTLRGAAWTAVAALAALTGACSAEGGAEVSPSASPDVSVAAVDPDQPLEGQLYEAVRAGDAALVQALIEAGVDVDAEVAGGSTALHLAVTRGDAALVEAILAAGPDLTKVDDRGVPLMNLACRQGAPLEVMQMLLEAGTAIDQPTPDNVGSYPMHECAASGNIDGLELLLAAGADVDTPQEIFKSPPITVAAWAGNYEAVEFLLAAGADPTIAGTDGGTPRSWALSEGHMEIVALLESAGG